MARDPPEGSVDWPYLVCPGTCCPAGLCKSRILPAVPGAYNTRTHAHTHTRTRIQAMTHNNAAHEQRKKLIPHTQSTQQLVASHTHTHCISEASLFKFAN